MGFNIYYERDPSIIPAATCPNPAPVTNTKCALFGYPVSRESAVNVGQSRGPEDANGVAFQVVIVGSNGMLGVRYPSRVQQMTSAQDTQRETTRTVPPLTPFQISQVRPNCSTAPSSLLASTATLLS
jgi:hypothetical protein